MSQTNVAITQLLQVGLTERIAQEAQAHPEVVKQAAQQAAPEILRQQNSTVPKTDDAESSRKIKSRDGGRQRSGADGRRRKHFAAAEQAEPESETSPAADTPWAGNIVNLKV